jgi:hypothetical protein
MPLEVYSQVLSQTQEKLCKLFAYVDSPIEAPGKESYGDVDILVFGAQGLPAVEQSEAGNANRHEAALKLAAVLGAKDWIAVKGNPTMNFAVPWPSNGGRGSETSDVDVIMDGGGELELGLGKYVQVDVKLCDSLADFQWELFHEAHGDLWNILGTTIRKYGLTVNNVGMHLRIPEIEANDRKKSMVFLSSEPDAILRFLGLDKEKWWKPFGSLEGMFLYAAGCRMFWVKDIGELDGEGEGEGERKGHEEIGTGDMERVIEGQEGGEMGKKKLRHNDRQRIKKRTIFAQWMDEFIPKCRKTGLYQESSMTREQIRDDAFKIFGVRSEYQARLGEWLIARNRDDVKTTIKRAVPLEMDETFRTSRTAALKARSDHQADYQVDHQVDPQVGHQVEASWRDFRAASIRALKAFILENEELDGFAPVDWSDGDKPFDLGMVEGYVDGNWRRAGEAGLARQKERAQQRMRIKSEKQKLVKEASGEDRSPVIID